MIFAGVDPGKNGGIALIYATDNRIENVEVYCWDDDIFADKMLKQIDMVVVEKVWGQKWDTPKTAFSLGHSLGYIETVLKIFKKPYQLVPPQRWKKEYSLDSDKQKSIDCAKKLFPGVNLKRTERCTKDHDGMAEALLIAEYGRRHFK